MKKNGFTFVSIVETCKMESGVWNPSYYKENQNGSSLSDFAMVQKIEHLKQDISLCEFAPIEYKQLPKGELLTCSLEDNHLTEGRYSVVGEQILLFGTMRAYLGNVLVTPKSEWLGKTSPIFFPINSEFVKVIPKDGFVYFWWSYFKSPQFLNQMPTGNGGTRPRISAESLSQIPVSVPPIEQRAKINHLLLNLAQQAWDNFNNCKKIIQNQFVIT
jgi:hypothetical protein